VSSGSASQCEEMNVTPLVQPAAICLLVIGLVLLIVAILGLVGTCCSSRLIMFVVSRPTQSTRSPASCIIKLEFRGTDTDTDTDIRDALYRVIL